MSETDRVAVVVGGASGIGAAVAAGLAAEGCRVIVADRNADGAAALAAGLGSPHTSAQVDVTDEDTVAGLFEQVGPIDVVVNTAGFGDYGAIVDLDAERFRAVIDCCLTGSFLVMKHAGRQLQEGGSLVSITSLNARLAAPGMSAYCAAKAGLAMLTTPCRRGSSTPR